MGRIIMHQVDVQCDYPSCHETFTMSYKSQEDIPKGQWLILCPNHRKLTIREALKALGRH